MKEMIKPRKYEKKQDKRKTKQVSIRLSEEAHKRIVEKSNQSHLSINEFIRQACMECEIKTIDSGKEIVTVIQDLRESIQNLPPVFRVDDFNNALSEAVIKLAKHAH